MIDNMAEFYLRHFYGKRHPNFVLKTWNIYNIPAHPRRIRTFFLTKSPLSNDAVFPITIIFKKYG